MASLPGWLLPLWFLFAAIWALGGTNAQAQLARKQLLADDDPLIADAGRAWTPFRLAAPRRSRRQRAIEAELREDPERWARYDELRRQMRAWNLLESSVALAAGASILALIASFGGSGSTAPTEPASSSSHRTYLRQRPAAISAPGSGNLARTASSQLRARCPFS